jgi:ADP-ribosylation factor 2-binding protein
MIVGTLQEIIIDAEFEIFQKKFCNEYCMHFEATEENKLIYTDIFKKYHDTIETYINQVKTTAFLNPLIIETDRGYPRV